ncbi:MAG TPA: roadblock/LC7 domain-containing protein [Aggregatilineales bacterium]|jgi:predicted regulator of Ras-like GTPase activity (Roadblock/LC7/MglB family)|nr:roadblock/LC7 domain-containing protein [Anaerolineae bacterium]HUN06310.1 roadblock/LC7 domain-containing protein [Aggregatilineales bacterium]
MAQITRQKRLETALETLYRGVEGIQATVIVNVDGLLVAAYPPGDEENPHENPTSSPQVAAMSATLIGLAERTLGRLAQGKLQRLLMEGEEAVMVVYPAGRASLAVLAEKNARLAPILPAVKTAAQEVADILGN